MDQLVRFATDSRILYGNEEFGPLLEFVNNIQRDPILRSEYKLGLNLPLDTIRSPVLYPTAEQQLARFGRHVSLLTTQTSFTPSGTWTKVKSPLLGFRRYSPPIALEGIPTRSRDVVGRYRCWSRATWINLRQHA